MFASVIASTANVLAIANTLELVTPVTANPILSPPFEFLILAKTVELPASVVEALRYCAWVNADKPLIDSPAANWTLVINGF